MNRRSILVLIVFLSTWLVGLVDAEWIALWPSLVALTAVFLLNRTITGLLLGAGAGILLLENGNPLRAFAALFSGHLIPVLQSSWNLSVLIFTLLLGGFAALLEQGGGLQALMRKRLLSGESSGKSVQWAAYSLGLICFFDGLANSMLVGKSMSPLAGRAGVSRARLAYIVDSTSSAVACVAVISTWIAYQLSMIREGLAQAGVDARPFHLFLQSIPLNYYCWFTLILLAVVISKDWNIGPMKTSRPTLPDDVQDADAPQAKAWRAVVPLVYLIAGLLTGLYLNGAEGEFLPLTFERVSDAYGRADAAQVLVCVSASAALLAFVLSGPAIRKTGQTASHVFNDGLLKLFNPVLILISAWVLSSTLKELHATEVLARLLEGSLPASLFPMLVFVTGAAISFSTGTSWGTMGILMPLALPVALTFSGGDITPLIPGTIAAVFSGAVFGDHCSPFSDTTIVSSISCGLEPMEHVRTQMPFALIAAAVAICAGFLPTGLGLNPYIALGIGTLLLISLPALSNHWKKPSA
jgi:Na+/H+ antiporter NhaC